MNDVRMHSGLVVYDGSSSESGIPAAVLDLDELHETGLPRVRQISREAFRLPNHMLNLEAEQKKNLTRRFSKPLYFGDSIEFDASKLKGNDLIKSFNRLKPYIDSELVGGVKKISLIGIINPADHRHLYTEYFDKIEIPDEFIDEGYPNVCLKVWIELNYCLDLNRLDYAFHSFREICSIDDQMDVSMAPWNRGTMQYSLIPIDDSDDDDNGGLMYSCVATLAGDKSPDMELFQKLAYLTGPRTFLLADYPQYKCIAPLKDHKLKIGNVYSVSCAWNMYDKMYMITHSSNSNKLEPLPVFVNEDEKETLKCSVKAHETIPGIYYHKDFKYFDDPKGILSFLHLTKFKNNAIPISFVDGDPSNCGQFRFRVDKILGDKKKKMEDFLKNEEIVVSRATGIVIDDQTVFSADHGTFTFMFDMLSTPPPVGTWVTFDASYNKEEKFFKITKWNVKSEMDGLTVAQRRMVAKKNHQKQLIFKVKVKTHNEKDLNKMFFCAEFGLLDDNLGIVTLETRNPRAAVYTVWVKWADADAKDNPPRTPFHIIGVGDDIPDDRVEEPSVSEEHTEMKRRFVEKMNRAAENGGVQVRSSRFSAPKKVKDAAIQKAAQVREAPIAKTPEKKLDYTQGAGFSSNSSLHTRSPTINSSNSGNLYARVINTPQGIREERTDDRFMAQQFESVQISPKVSPPKRRTEDLPRPIVQKEERRTSSSPFEGHPHSHPGFRRERRDIPEYTGAVLNPPGSEGKYNVPETIARLKTHVPHSSTCGANCNPSCPQLREIVILMVQVDGFWDEADVAYPSLTSDIRKYILSAQDHS